MGEEGGKNMLCKECKSENTQVLGRDKKYSGCLGCLGFLIWGWIGLLLGLVGKWGKYECVCLDCGARFNC